MLNIEQEEEMKQEAFRQNGAALYVTQFIRGHIIRYRLKELLIRHRLQMIVRIQRFMRLFLQKKRYEKYLIELEKRNKLENSAAVAIQRIWRGYAARILYDIKLVEKVEWHQKRIRRKRKILKKVTSGGAVDIILNTHQIKY
jgi:hypothetical protein